MVRYGLALLVVCLGMPALAAPLPEAQAAAATEAWREGAEWLLAQQHEDGSWGGAPQAAITALSVLALVDAPIDAQRRQTAIERGMTFVLSKAEQDGSVRAEPTRHFLIFSDAGYPVYTTAVALLAMLEVNHPAYEPYMQGARAFLKAAQVTESGDSYGGFGYKPGARADMSNTSWAAEALRYSEHLDDEVARAESAEMWKRLRSFLAESQNLPPSLVPNPEAEGADGGFAYKPGTLVSSGSMTYAGLKSMIYADLDRQDPRVKAALDFARRHYTVDENPGQGLRGLYYYLQAMGKALDVAGVETLTTAPGEARSWRADLVAKLVAEQRDSGAWINEDGRYMESVPELVTAYSLITLKRLLRDQ